MSAASFLGIAGLVALSGFDGLIYSIGFLVGWPVVVCLIAEPLRNLGKFTFSDVVAFRHRGQVWVKRVVALRGDTVALRDGRLFVDGTRVRESYADPRRIDSVYFGPVRGRQREREALRDSVDSRRFGPVRVDQIEGRVVATVWPWHRVAGGVGR